MLTIRRCTGDCFPLAVVIFIMRSDSPELWCTGVLIKVNGLLNFAFIILGAAFAWSFCILFGRYRLIIKLSNTTLIYARKLKMNLLLNLVSKFMKIVALG
jgi:hypothetical protein